MDERRKTTEGDDIESYLEFISDGEAVSETSEAPTEYDYDDRASEFGDDTDLDPDYEPGEDSDIDSDSDEASHRPVARLRFYIVKLHKIT
jgi:hypothetical protein